MSAAPEVDRILLALLSPSCVGCPLIHPPPPPPTNSLQRPERSEPFFFFRRHKMVSSSCIMYQQKRQQVIFQVWFLYVCLVDRGGGSCRIPSLDIKPHFEPVTLFLLELNVLPISCYFSFGRLFIFVFFFTDLHPPSILISCSQKHKYILRHFTPD